MSGRAWAVARIGRLAGLALHLALGLAISLLAFPLLSRSARARVRQAWSQRLLGVLGLRIECRGLAALPPGCLIVANHISWVDVFAINAVAPVAFVAKSEVRGWPFMGWLAARNDTFFLHRDRRSHARVVNGGIAGAMAAGRRVALFPEGTSTDGTQVLAFHGALFQPAVDAGSPVVPVAIGYETADGMPSRAAAYAGEITFWQSIRAIVGTRGLRVRLTFCAPLDGAGADRKALARRAHAAIADVLAGERGQALRDAA